MFFFSLQKSRFNVNRIMNRRKQEGTARLNVIRFNVIRFNVTRFNVIRLNVNRGTEDGQPSRYASWHLSPCCWREEAFSPMEFFDASPRHNPKEKRVTSPNVEDRKQKTEHRRGWLLVYRIDLRARRDWPWIEAKKEP